MKENIEKKINKFLNEITTRLLFTDKEKAKEVAKYMEKNIDAPYVYADISDLGRSTILLKISLDEPDTWENKIYQNSRYFQISLEPNPMKNNLEQFSKSYRIKKKFRKQKAETVKDAVEKINNYIKRVK